jgi:hypothetical protein
MGQLWRLNQDHGSTDRYRKYKCQELCQSAKQQRLDRLRIVAAGIRNLYQLHLRRAGSERKYNDKLTKVQ